MSGRWATRGTTWLVTELPCPNCGGHDIVGFALVDETGKHQHTKFRCTRWIQTVPRERRRVDVAEDWGHPCDWEGWSVPGWDHVVDVEAAGPVRLSGGPDRRPAVSGRSAVENG